MMTHQDQQVTCTSDAWCGCPCADCTITFDHCQPSQHPVDSTYLPCCGVIGAQHTADCPQGDQLDAALRFDGAANMIALAIADIEKAQEQLPPDSSMWDAVDLVRVTRHLRAAARLVDSVADRIGTPAVTR
jgi:hypothetical protein